MFTHSFLILISHILKNKVKKKKRSVKKPSKEGQILSPYVINLTA